MIQANCCVKRHNLFAKGGQKLNKPMTAADLFNKICDILKEKEAFPDILDYAVVEHDLIPITTYEFGLGNHLDYGGSEGIYLDLWITIYGDNEPQHKSLGTFKTLRDDPESMRIMGKLLADFIIETRAYVNANLDDFAWEGADIRIFDENDKQLNMGYSCGSMERALKKKDEFLQKYPRVVIRDNATREETSYSI